MIAWFYKYNITDHLGNLRVSLKDSSGIAVPLQSLFYDPWGLSMKGMAITRNPANFNNFTFLNRELQVETGLVDLTNRQYDPQRGQFTSQDEIIEGQEDLTLYQYGWNNPVLKSDPDGQYPGEGIVNTILNWLISKPSESDKKLGEIYSYNAYNGHPRQIVNRPLEKMNP